VIHTVQDSIVHVLDAASASADCPAILTMRGIVTYCPDVPGHPDFVYGM
jgi:hypothetical protein